MNKDNHVCTWIPLPKWDGKKWVPKGPYTSPEQLEQPIVEWPECIDVNLLPEPRFNIGDKVRFEWDKGFLVGIIKKISLCGGGTIACYEKDPQKKYNAIYYEIYANGHGRAIFDYGDKKIELYRELPNALLFF